MSKVDSWGAAFTVTKKSSNIFVHKSTTSIKAIYLAFNTAC